jgi:hypothetical protein
MMNAGPKQQHQDHLTRHLPDDIRKEHVRPGHLGAPDRPTCRRGRGRGASHLLLALSIDGPFLDLRFGEGSA